MGNGVSADGLESLLANGVVDGIETGPATKEGLLRLLAERSRPAPEMLDPEDCLQGNAAPCGAPPGSPHLISRNPIAPSMLPAGYDQIQLGMGCFWCSENLFMRKKGLYSSAVGYAQGETPNPSYDDVCSGQTNHNEVVRLIYDRYDMPLYKVLRLFWESHDPTTLFQQGGDCGTQYRSGIYYFDDAQKIAAEESRDSYAAALRAAGCEAPITTEILPASCLHLAEPHHQQRDAKPGVDYYCGLSPLGVKCPRLLDRRTSGSSLRFDQSELEETEEAEKEEVDSDSEDEDEEDEAAPKSRQ